MTKRCIQASLLGVLVLALCISLKASAAEDFSYMVDSGYWYMVECTAYCDKGITASGVPVREGIVATTPSLMGKTIVIYDLDGNLIGHFEALDTGSDRRIQNGSCVDIYLPSYAECIEWGRQDVWIEVLDCEG